MRELTLLETGYLAGMLLLSFVLPLLMSNCAPRDAVSKRSCMKTVWIGQALLAVAGLAVLASASVALSRSVAFDKPHFAIQSECRMTVPIMLKRPSGFLPVGMSLVALVVVLVHVLMFGTARQADEGAAAHVWQLLMAGQVPILAFFLIKWLPQALRPTLLMLALQVVAALAAIAPVYFLHL